MKNIFLILTLILATPKLRAEWFTCLLPDGPHKGMTTFADATNAQDAMEIVRALYKTESDFECRETPKQMPISALYGKKWLFVGKNFSEAHLVFENQVLKHVQNCGKYEMTHYYKTEIVSENSFKLTEDRMESPCSVFSVPGFETGSVISVRISKASTEPHMLVIHDARPGNPIRSSSLYRETK